MRLLFVAIFAAAVAAGVFSENQVSDEDETINDPQDGQRYQVIIGLRPLTDNKYPEDENKTIVVVPVDGIIWIDGQRFAISADNGNRTDARLVVVGGRPHRPRPSWNQYQQQLSTEHPGPWHSHGHPFPGHRISWWNAYPQAPPLLPGGHGNNLINWWGAFPRPWPSPHQSPQLEFSVVTGKGETLGEEQSKDKEIVESSTELPEGKYDIIDLRTGF